MNINSILVNIIIVNIILVNINNKRIDKQASIKSILSIFYILFFISFFLIENSLLILISYNLQIIKKFII